MAFYYLCFIAGLVSFLYTLASAQVIYCWVAIILISLGVLGVRTYRVRSGDFFCPIFIFSAVIVLSCVYGGVVRFQSGDETQRIIERGLFYACLFVIAFVAGCIGPAGAHVSKIVLPRFNLSVSRTRLRFWTGVFLTLGLLVFIALAWQAGFTGPLDLSRNLLGFRRYWGQMGRAYLMFIALFCVQAPFWAWLFGNASEGMRNRKWLFLYGGIVLGTAFLTGTRGEVFTVVSGLFFCWLHGKRMTKTIQLLPAGVIVLVVGALFYVIQGQIRGGGVNEVDIQAVLADGQDIRLDTAFSAFASRFVDPFDGFLAILENSSTLDFGWGQSIYDALFLPVPRALVPDKPYAFGMQMLKQIYPTLDTGFFGTDFSILGELYVNFQIIGLLFGGYLVGVILKTIQVCYSANLDNFAFLFVYRPLMFLPYAWFANGLINSEANALLATNLSSCLLFLWLIRNKPRSVA